MATSRLYSAATAVQKILLPDGNAYEAGIDYEVLDYDFERSINSGAFEVDIEAHSYSVNSEELRVYAAPKTTLNTTVNNNQLV